MITQDNIDRIPEIYLQQVFDGVNYHFLETQEEVDLFASFVAPKIENGVISEGATQEQIFMNDPRNQPDYYLVRAEAGKKFVNDVTFTLLTNMKNGTTSLQQTMIIEEILEKVINKLNDGQFYSAKYKLSLVHGQINENMYNMIMTEIDNLILIHYL